MEGKIPKYDGTKETCVKCIKYLCKDNFKTLLKDVEKELSKKIMYR